jgi:hypothetical protein
MPTLQQQAIKMTKEAVNGLFATARHVPQDKRNDWKPMGEARSTVSQLTECALTPFFFVSILRGEKVDMTDPTMAAKRKEMEAAITTLELAESAALKNHEMLYSVIAELSDADLDRTVPLPWNPAGSSVADIIFFDYWNLVYHTGQINYIQLMLGDTDMQMG